MDRNEVGYFGQFSRNTETTFYLEVNFSMFEIYRPCQWFLVRLLSLSRLRVRRI